MRFLLRITAPEVKRIIQHHRMAQRRPIVRAEQDRHPQGGREQSARRDMQVRAFGIGAAHDGGEAGHRRIVRAVPGDERIERTVFPLMRVGRAGDIEGRAAKESGVGPGVHGDDMVRKAEEGVASGSYSASPDEEGAADAVASVTTITMEAQAAASEPTGE